MVKRTNVHRGFYTAGSTNGPDIRLGDESTVFQYHADGRTVSSSVVEMVLGSQ